MYKQPDSGSSGTINIRSAPLAKSSHRAILASARLAKTTMASSSSSRSKPKSCKRRTSSIFTASMRTSFPSCRDLGSILIYRESVRFGCVPSPPLHNLPKNLHRRLYRGQRLQRQPLEISESERALGCPVHDICDLHAPQLAHTLRFADQIGSGGPKALRVFADRPLGRGAVSSVAVTVRCISGSVPVAY